LPVRPYPDERFAVVTGVLIARPACIVCIARKARLAEAHATETLERLADGLRLRHEPGVCGICRAQTHVFSMVNTLS